MPHCRTFVHHAPIVQRIVPEGPPQRLFSRKGFNCKNEKGAPRLKWLPKNLYRGYTKPVQREVTVVAATGWAVADRVSIEYESAPGAGAEQDYH